jgi:hypothetical protein
VDGLEHPGGMVCMAAIVGLLVVGHCYYIQVSAVGIFDRFSIRKFIYVALNDDHIGEIGAARLAVSFTSSRLQEKSFHRLPGCVNH